MPMTDVTISATITQNDMVNQKKGKNKRHPIQDAFSSLIYHSLNYFANFKTPLSVDKM